MPTKRKTKKDPYAGKTIAFDTLGNSFKNNPRGTVGFFLAIIAFLIDTFLDHSMYTVPLSILLTIIFLPAGWLVLSGLFKKPNGLPAILVAIWIIKTIVGTIVFLLNR